jgi:chromosomal replication initiator protein
MDVRLPGREDMTQAADARVDEDSGTWSQTLDQLESVIPKPYYSSIIEPLLCLLSVENETCTVGVPNSFTRDIVESRYKGDIRNALSSVLEKEVNVIFTVSSSPAVIESVASRVSPPPEDLEDNRVKAEFQPPANQQKYTFENFIVGDSNKFAYNAALMVAEFPGNAYNPLFIHGGTGLGKTHLLYAIEDFARTMNPSTRVTYVQTSKFIDEFIATITLKRDKSLFNQKYINNKIVLFDDIQALSGTDATQNKFFDIFNVLYSSSSHIVLSSDRPPSEIPQLSDRIRSRFEGGLMIDIKPPDIETRLAILRLKLRGLKLRDESLHIPDDALIYMASKVKDNIRSLEGLLHRVIAYARLYGTRIDLGMVQDVLKDQVSESALIRTPTVEMIQDIVSNYYGIPVADLTGKSRSRPLVQSRQIAIYLCRELTDETLIRIGNFFGGRDHTTVLHSCKKVESLIKLKREMFQEITQLTNMINKAI